MIINSFWHGKQVSCLELLTVQSFLDYGHDFCIWTYTPEIKYLLPSKTQIYDANKILCYSKFFKYEGNGDCKKDSVGGFSDIFRYYILKNKLGWYVDMDVTCLDYFGKLKDNIILKPHKNTGVVANIIKFDEKLSVIDDILHETEKTITKTNDKWILPLKIFEKHIKKNSLEKYIVPLEYFGNDDIKQINSFLRFNIATTPLLLPKFAIHWCNTAISTGTWHNGKFFFNKENPVRLSLYESLLKKHNIRF